MHSYFKTFLTKVLTSATVALYAMRQRTFMSGSYSNELRSDFGFVVAVSPDPEFPGIRGLKNCTRTYSLTVLDSSRSGLVVSRLASLIAHARRRHFDGSINVGAHQYGRSIEQAERRLLCFQLGMQHPEPSSESSVSR
jgi:hypothetical protein